MWWRKEREMRIWVQVVLYGIAVICPIDGSIENANDIR